MKSRHEGTLDGDSWYPVSEKPVTGAPVSNLFVERLPAGRVGGLGRVTRQVRRRRAFLEGRRRE